MFNPAPLAPSFRWQTSVIPSGGGSGLGLIVAANPMRLSLILSTVSSTCVIGPNINITTSAGILLTQGLSPMVFSYSDWAVMVGNAWYVVQPSTAVIYVAELIAVDNGSN